MSHLTQSIATGRLTFIVFLIFSKTFAKTASLSRAFVSSSQDGGGGGNRGGGGKRSSYFAGPPLGGGPFRENIGTENISSGGGKSTNVKFDTLCVPV